MGRLTGKTAIVTGAAQGLGGGIATRFLDEGAEVLAVDMLDCALSALEGREGCATLRYDLTAADAPKAVIDACLSSFGKVDILVNNAGKGNAPPLEDTTDEIFDFYIDTNLRSTFRLSRDILPELRKTRGTIVNIASSTAVRGHTGWAPYVMSKAAIMALTQNMAAQFGREGIRVNAIAPGVTVTEATASRMTDARFRAMLIGTTPLNQPAQVGDIANAALYLASEEARHVTAQILTVDGGQTATCYVDPNVVEPWIQQENSKT